MASRAVRRVKTSLKYIWREPGFYVGSGKNRAYYDRGYDQIIETHFDNMSIRQQVLSRLPLVVDSTTKEFIPEFNKVFSPSTFNCDNCLYFGTDKTILNSAYPPFTVLANVIRDYYNEFKTVVNGVVVSSKEVYESIKERFNDLYIKLTTFKFAAAFVLGSCSVEEFVLLGSLFYILQMSCNNSNGLTFDDGLFDNEWSGELTIVTVNDKAFKCYSQKLKRANFCSIAKSAFVSRFSEISDEFSLWYYEYFTEAYNNTIAEEQSIVQPHTILFDLRDCLLKLSGKKSKVFALFYSDSMFNEDLITQTSAIKIKDNYYKDYSNGLFIETEVMSSKKGEIKKYTIITNYDTSIIREVKPCLHSS